MFASARIPTIALAVLFAFAFATAPAMARASDDEAQGLPLTPPPVESSTPHDEGAPTAQPSGSIGFAMLAALLGPLGLALGGVTTAAAVSDYAPNAHPLVSPVGPDRPIR
jgi:hypothetical protein